MSSMVERYTSTDGKSGPLTTVLKDGGGRNHVCLPKDSDKSGCVSTRMDLLENTRRMGPIFVICYVPA